MAPASVSAEDLSGLVSAIYESALTQATWDSTMRDLTEVLRAGSTSLLTISGTAQAPNGAVAGGDAFMVQHTSSMDSRPADALVHLVDYAKDTLAKRDTGSARLNAAERDVFAPLFQRDGTSTWIAVGAPGSDALSSTEGLALLRLLLPHLQRAARVHASIAELTVERDHALHVLNLMTNGVLIVGECGRLLFANTAATEILGRRDGLARQHDGTVTATCHRDNLHFQRLLSETCGTKAPNSSGQRGGSLSISRLSGRRKLVVHVTEFSDRNCNRPPRDRCALVTVIDLDGDQPKTHPHLWRGLYNLTTTEATVAEQVSRGEGLKAVAKQLSVSLSTVRVHLQHVFEKTGTHRQAELARLILTVQQGATAARVPATGEP